MANSKFESLAYSLHFHSKSNYISANYYERLDQTLTYVSTLATVLGSTGGGVSLIGNTVDSASYTRLKTFATLMTLTATIATGYMNNLNGTEQSPAKKQARHNRAAYRMKELCLKVEAWSDETLRSDRRDSDLLTKYEEFVNEQRKIEEECIKSEDWTFAQVHDQLSPKWRQLGERMGKFIPDKETEKKCTVNGKIVLLCGTLVTLAGLWKLTLYLVEN